MKLVHIAAAIVVLLAVATKWVSDVMSDLQLEKQLSPATMLSNSQCTLLHGSDKLLVGSEDLQLAKHGMVFIGSGDLKNTFEKGARNATPGGIYVFNVSSSPATAPVKLQLIDLPKEESVSFQVHGIFVSNVTDRLYAVAHRGAFSSVEIFAVEYGGLMPGVRLRHVRSVRSNLFPLCGINDVVEGRNRGELYVSRWLPYGYPESGGRHPTTTQETIKEALRVPIMILKLRMTSVFRCVYEEDSPELPAVCEVTSDTLFVGANGLATTPDRKTVFVNDPPSRRIHKMHPNKQGYLEPSGVIELPHSADNIEFDEQSGELVMGTIPLVSEVLAHLKNSSAAVSGGLLVMRPIGVEAWEASHELNHDGTMLSQISAAVRFGKRIVLGSPFSSGVLVCDL